MPSYILNSENINLSTDNIVAQGFNAEIPVSEVELTASDYDIRAMCINLPLNLNSQWFKTQTGNKLPFLITWEDGEQDIDITTTGRRWDEVPPFLKGVGADEWMEYKRVYILTKSSGGVFQMFEISEVASLSGGAYMDITGNTVSPSDNRRLTAVRPATTSTSTSGAEAYILWSKQNVPADGPVLTPDNGASIFPLWQPGSGFVRSARFRFDPTKWGGNKFYISNWTIYDWGTNSGLSAGSRDMATNYASSQSGTPITKCNFDSAADLVTALQNILIRAGWNISSTVTSIPNAATLAALSHANKDIILYYTTYATTELNDYATTALQFTIFEPTTTEADDRYYLDLSTDPVFGQITVKADMSGVFKGIWDAPIDGIAGHEDLTHTNGDPLVTIATPVSMYIQNGDVVTISGCSATTLNGNFIIADVQADPVNTARCNFTIIGEKDGNPIPSYSLSTGVTSEAVGIATTKRVKFMGGESIGGALLPGGGLYSAYSINTAEGVAGSRTDAVPVYQETGVRVPSTETTSTIPEDSTLVNNDNDNGIYLENSTDLGDSEFEIFIKYTLYDGSDALIARKLVEMGVPVSPDNIKWYVTHLEIPDEDEFEMELDEVEFEALEYEPDYKLDEEGYNYDDERQRD